jgi:CSLREA domain-containing protein
MRRLALIAAFFLASPSPAAIFTVNSIGNEPDDMPGDGICAIAGFAPPRCTLRAAIQEANAVEGVDRIHFSIGPTTILVSGTALPTITDGLIVDGTTAPGYNNEATLPENAPPSVYLSGISLGGSARGLRSNGDHLVHILGLGVTNFPGHGIEVSGSIQARVDRNWIGLDRHGNAAGNGGSGLFLQNCETCLVGQWMNFTSPPQLVGLGNLIGSNAEDGIYLIGGIDNRVGSNLIGVNPAFLPRGNGRHGVQVISADARIGELIALGGTEFVSTPNYIYHNAQDGVNVFASNARVYTNHIRYNSRHGVNAFGAGNRIGFILSNTRNWINANGGHGVVLGGLAGSTRSLAEYNWIWENGGRGVHVASGSAHEVYRNAIFQNGDDAIRLDAPGCRVEENEIGLALGDLAGNAANGVVMNASDGLVSANTIGGMADDGVDVVSGSGNRIWGNRIGATASGQNVGNANVGIRVRSAASGTRIESNRIGFNLDGIRLEGSSSAICGNYIGLGPDWLPTGNLSEGIRVLGNDNLIGDPGGGCPGNHIGRNGSDGIQVESAGNLIRGNGIGGTYDTDYGNGMGGILLTTGAQDNTIANNLIYGNGSAGVRVGLLAGTGNRIVFNVYRTNVGLPIDLREDGVTPNDAGDVDEGPNRLQNFPVLTAINGGLGELTVSYRVDTDLARGDYPLTVDFYVNTAGHTGGFFVHRDTYSVAPNSIRTVSFTTHVSSGFILAMATDAAGNSSELSAPLPYSFLPLPMELFRNGFEP